MTSLSPLAVDALKEALSLIYWYKADLRSFLTTALTGEPVLARVDWNESKRVIVRGIVDDLLRDPARHLDRLTFLLRETARFESFDKLEQVEGGREKAQAARDAVGVLRRMMQSHEEATSGENEAAQRRRRAREERERALHMQSGLAALRSDFQSLVGKPPQRRGFDLEGLMKRLFALYELDPRASFRIEGEQVDGAFSLEGSDYLFEAKWAGMVAARDLDVFAQKVQRKLQNTRGVLLSIDGFQPEGVAAHARGARVLILMTGADLMAVLDERIGFTRLLVRKRRHAAETGEILWTFQQMPEE